ncbi:MAG TPA: 16S rRNA (cytidine(1402)-2'-O)-methyltransferase [Bryobacteraceae bacterium]|nr:16S rRNA (cytidine(1402)-2'-O)-methyltransferase [Bryobacteraceae bacterium]
MTGTLFIISTPIGNLEDITMRAVRLLREADVIACEDTRQTRKLLDHFGISKPMLSYHEHNEAARSAELIERLRAGENVGLVSDAGTPLVSDPGYRLVTAAIGAGISVVPVPGPSAVMTALAAAGLATDSFRFCGFLPPKTSARRKLLEELKNESCTLVFYEAPHRVLAALDDVTATMGARPVVVARELTKLHEEFLRGTAEEVRARLAARPVVRGEIVLLIGKAEEAAQIDETPVAEAVRALEQRGVARMDAIKQVAKARGMSKRDCYRLLTS